MPDRLRLFVAVEVPEAIKAVVGEAADALKADEPDWRWTDPGSWHLTVAFLGWTDAQALADVRRCLDQVTGDSGPFDLALTGAAGCFSGRVLWAGLEDSPALEDLAARTRAALAGAGMALEERAFHAHLTLARAPRGRRMPAGLASRYRGPAHAWRVERLDLMRSHLRRGGARYELVDAWRLGRLSGRLEDGQARRSPAAGT